MHFAKKNPRYKYTMNRQVLTSVDTEKDLGVLIAGNLMVYTQCTEAKKKANRMLGMISRNVRCRDPYVLTRLYKTLVRSHVEYCTAVWSPYCKKDKEAIEMRKFNTDSQKCLKI